MGSQLVATKAVFELVSSVGGSPNLLKNKTINLHEVFRNLKGSRKIEDDDYHNLCNVFINKKPALKE